MTKNVSDDHFLEGIANEIHPEGMATQAKSPGQSMDLATSIVEGSDGRRSALIVLIEGDFDPGLLFMLKDIATDAFKRFPMKARPATESPELPVSGS